MWTIVILHYVFTRKTQFIYKGNNFFYVLELDNR